MLEDDWLMVHIAHNFMAEIGIQLSNLMLVFFGIVALLHSLKIWYLAKLEIHQPFLIISNVTRCFKGSKRFTEINRYLL